MVVVAVAGGTGGVGRTILDAVAASGRHQAIVLSRRSSETNHPKQLAVDYTNGDQIVQIFRENNVEVVMSALVLSDEQAAQSQIHLIRAAAQSGTVRKFIPSEYYIDFHAPIPGSDLFANFQLESEAELTRHPQLTWTLIRCGIFLDHLTMPHNPKTTHIAPFWVFVDIDHEKCVFPGHGDYPLVLTHSTDLAAYMERLIDLPAEDWPRESLVASNKLRVRDLEPLIRDTIGKQFEVVFDPEEAVHKGQITPLPSNQAVFDDAAKGDFLHAVELQVMLSMFSHAHNLQGKDLAEIFPEVEVTDIREFLRDGWELKKQSGMGPITNS